MVYIFKKCKRPRLSFLPIPYQVDFTTKMTFITFQFLEELDRVGNMRQLIFTFFCIPLSQPSHKTEQVQKFTSIYICPTCSYLFQRFIRPTGKQIPLLVLSLLAYHHNHIPQLRQILPSEWRMSTC
jgi:hypothetical protein